MMMIGGGGSSCRRADHGIGVTEANAPSLANLEEKDFGSETFDNLFVVLFQLVGKVILKKSWFFSRMSFQSFDSD